MAEKPRTVGNAGSCVCGDCDALSSRWNHSQGRRRCRHALCQFVRRLGGMPHATCNMTTIIISYSLSLSLAVHDASGKLNSGILNGNINQAGDFDQCMGIAQAAEATAGDDVSGDGAQPDVLRGQYCLAYAQPMLPHKSKRLQAFFKLMQSHGPFRSEFNDVRYPVASCASWWGR